MPFSHDRTQHQVSILADAKPITSGAGEQDQFVILLVFQDACLRTLPLADMFCFLAVLRWSTGTRFPGQSVKRHLLNTSVPWRKLKGVPANTPFQIQEEWRRNGLRLQIVSRWLLPRLGFAVLKGEEDYPDPKLKRQYPRLSPYLTEYADYLVRGNGRLAIVDVKAPVSFRMLKKPFAAAPILFTKHQWAEYGACPVPVKILLWEYEGLASLMEQRAPLRYGLVAFDALTVLEELAETMQASADSLGVRPRRLTVQRLKLLLQRSKAMPVIAIKPGHIVRVS